MHAAVEQADEQLNQLVADAAQSFGENVGAQQQHGADLRLFQRLAQPAGVAAHQVALQLLQVSGADAHIGQFAEAGVDAVGGFVAGDDALHHGLRRRDSLPRCRRNGCVHRAVGHLADLVERKWLPVQFQDAEGEDPLSC